MHSITLNIRILRLLLAAPSMAHATTWYVSSTGSDSNPGNSPNAPFATLQTAANHTQPGDIVRALNSAHSVPCPGCDMVDITTSGIATAPITY